MLSSIARAASAVLVLASLSVLCAYARVGTPPEPGFRLPDGTWLNGLAASVNSTSTIVAAAGSNQAGATQLAPGYALVEVDSGSGGIALPPAIAGTTILINNNLTTTLTIYPSIVNNPQTDAQDTINGTANVTAATHRGAAVLRQDRGLGGEIMIADGEHPAGPAGQRGYRRLAQRSGAHGRGCGLCAASQPDHQPGLRRAERAQAASAALRLECD
jgi:hypothetical protein